ncbi:hypothetical protein BHM03_00060898 [Ensete ventricosum]|nr:hypothetical protein BHM03_00060898 [Ensete ventricosum]
MRSCYVFIANAARRRVGQPRPAPIQVRPAAAKAPLQGAIGCGQAPCKGRPPAGVATRKREVSCGRGTNRKAAYRQKHRPLPARRGATPIEALLAGTMSAEGAFAGEQGQVLPAQGQRRRLRRRRRGQET